MKSNALKWAAFLFALFHVYTNVFASLSELWFSAIHFGGFAALCAFGFHHRPASDAPPILLREQIGRALLAVLALAVPVYLMLFENALYARETDFIWSDYLVGGLAILLALEFTRRTSGWFMPVLMLVSLCYMLFLGRYVPGVFYFPGLSAETVLYRSFFS